MYESIYAVVEFGNFSTKFLVARKQDSRIDCLYKTIEKNVFLKDNKIVNPLSVGNYLTKKQKEVKKLLKIDLTKIVFVYPVKDDLLIKEVNETIFINDKLNYYYINLILQKYNNKIENGKICLYMKTKNYLVDKLFSYKIAPIGKIVGELTIKLKLFFVDVDFYSKIQEALTVTNLKLLNFCLSFVSLSNEICYSNQKTLVIDTSFDFTNMYLYNNKDLVDYCTIEEKASNINKDLKYFLNLDDNSIENLKLKYGNLNFNSNESESFDLFLKPTVINFQGKELMTVEELNKIILARYEEMFTNIFSKYQIYFQEHEVKNIILVGGITKILNFNTFIKNTFENDEVAISVYKSPYIGINDNLYCKLIGALNYSDKLNKVKKTSDYSIKKFTLSRIFDMAKWKKILKRT
ncbi:hypothetical protein JTY60_01400 [symbiont of Argiope bruennichi]|uniref:hypothetical protein n=1 Tax=symbiont of Argiope bruennichi TaxID=2810479 RepID=UPI003DA42C2E